ncbi:hypothetical protein Vadar_004870 [Vaccinium darrowii]|uniref:Uncharacterized protein n=1 Tax=Vaccinium darrowii TaxID=229202 RepID=A0ACB7XXI9_9ERIC|nr:hypothetical protein Vadar_004870 [Vaccinium darrowii]
MERQQFPSTMRFLGFKDVVLDVKEEVLEEVKVEDVVLDVKEEMLKEEVLEEVKAEVKEEVVWDSQAECRFALLTEADVFGQKFDSEADAHAFYNAYARATGFSIRKDRIKKNGDDMDVEAKAVNDNSFPVMETTLTSLERHGAEVFSHAIFVKFQKEIVAESCLFLLGKQDTEDHYMYEVGKYGAPKKVWTVEYKPCNGIMKCSCLKVESVGIPCRHMISVMKREQLRQIPPGCVLSRWMRPTMQNGHEGPFLWNDSTTVTQSTRYGMLSSTFNMVPYYASHLDKEFDEVRKVALQMMCQVRKKWETKDWVDDMATNGNAECGDGEGRVDLFGVGDPVIVRTKGNPGGSSSAAAPRKPRRCSHCRSIGHTKRTCKKLHCRGVKDECTEEIMNQRQMKRSTDGASAAPARCIRRLKNEDDGDDDEEERSQNEKDANMADDWSSDDDAENDDEEDNEEGEDTDIGRPSKKAKNYC